MVFVVMTIWEGTEKGHHRVYVLRQHRYGKPPWNVVEHPPPRSLKRVFVESSGRFLGLMLEKAVHWVGVLHYGWAWNLASKMDGASSKAKPAALGYVFVPWFSTGTNSARDFR